MPPKDAGKGKGAKGKDAKVRATVIVPPAREILLQNVDGVGLPGPSLTPPSPPSPPFCREQRAEAPNPKP
jgi:hypothetical protein